MAIFFKKDLILKKVVYPGTFDPVTNGHLDIITRAARLFDNVVVAVSNNPQKVPLFSVEERVDMIQVATKNLLNVKVDSFTGLLVQYASSQNASAIIRGLREVSDFEYEFQMTLMNRKQMPDIETVFLMPNERYTYINSTIVKEIASFGGEIHCFLPENVVQKLNNKFDK